MAFERAAKDYWHKYDLVGSQAFGKYEQRAAHGTAFVTPECAQRVAMDLHRESSGGKERLAFSG